MTHTLVERLRDATTEEWKLKMPLGAMHLHCDIREAADELERLQALAQAKDEALAKIAVLGSRNWHLGVIYARGAITNGSADHG